MTMTINFNPKRIIDGKSPSDEFDSYEVTVTVDDVSDLAGVHRLSLAKKNALEETISRFYKGFDLHVLWEDWQGSTKVVMFVRIMKRDYGVTGYAMLRGWIYGEPTEDRPLTTALSIDEEFSVMEDCLYNARDETVVER